MAGLLPSKQINKSKVTVTEYLFFHPLGGSLFSHLPRNNKTLIFINSKVNLPAENICFVAESGIAENPEIVIIYSFHNTFQYV